jgi:hypothetical protein
MVGRDLFGSIDGTRPDIDDWRSTWPVKDGY